MSKKTPLAVQGTAVEAVPAARDLVFAGFSDWRLPRPDNFEGDGTPIWLEPVESLGRFTVVDGVP